jgi:hypothetical protein
MDNRSDLFEKISKARDAANPVTSILKGWIRAKAKAAAMPQPQAV